MSWSPTAVSIFPPTAELVFLRLARRVFVLGESNLCYSVAINGALGTCLIRYLTRQQVDQVNGNTHDTGKDG